MASPCVARCALAFLTLGLALTPARAEDKPARSRTFLFTYAATLTGLPQGKAARVWLPVPPPSADQEIRVVSLPPGSLVRREAVHGNLILHAEVKADARGVVPLEAVYRVTRREVRGEQDKGGNDDTLYLKPNATVPVDGKPLDLLKGKTLPKEQLATARVLYDVVNGHLRYGKEGTGWGRGDSVWACDSGYGNCTDFHSLFMSLARAHKIPVKFEIGFPLPEARGKGEIPGYHCWAKFKPAGRGWIPVDISEANKNPQKKDYYFGNLTEDRVTFSTGRDLTLTPRQDGPPLNFFVYPYAEVDGKPYDQVQKKFTYEDVK